MTQDWGNTPTPKAADHSAPGYPADPTAAMPGPLPQYPAPAAYPPPAYPQGQPSWAQQAYAQGAYAQPAASVGAQGPTGYAQPVYPATAYQQPGYQQPGYPPVSYLGAPAKARKPGVVTAAAVLGFVQAGFLVIAGIVTLNGLATLSDLNLEIGSSYGSLLTAMGVLTLISAGLLIAGGVSAFGKRPWLLVAGAALSLLLSVWWAIQFDFFGVVITWSILLAVMPIISISLILGSSAKAWMSSAN